MYISKKRVEDIDLYEEKRHKTLNLLWAISRKDWKDINKYINEWVEFRKKYEDEIWKMVKNWYPSFEKFEEEINQNAENWEYKIWKKKLENAKTQEEKNQVFQEFLKYEFKKELKKELAYEETRSDVVAIDGAYTSNDGEFGYPYDSYHMSPLHYALFEVRDYEIAEKLLEAGADPDNPHGEFGLPPMHLAVDEENYEIIELLLKYHADINARSIIPDEKVHFGLPAPIHLAKTPQMIKYLLERGANPNAKTAYGRTPLHQAVMPSEKEKDENGNTRVGAYKYITEKAIEEVKVLLEYGADPNIQDNYDKTPIDLAKEYQKERIEILKEYDMYDFYKEKYDPEKIKKEIEIYDQILKLLEEYKEKNRLPKVIRVDLFVSPDNYDDNIDPFKVYYNTIRPLKIIDPYGLEAIADRKHGRERYVDLHFIEVYMGEFGGYGVKGVYENWYDFNEIGESKKSFIKYIKENAINVNAKHPANKRTPLQALITHIAIPRDKLRSGKLSEEDIIRAQKKERKKEFIAEWLLEMGAYLTINDYAKFLAGYHPYKYERFPTSLNVFSGKIEEEHIGLQPGALINIANALNMALALGKFDIASVLLDYGADPNLAAVGGRLNNLQILIDHNLFPRKPYGYIDYSKDDPNLTDEFFEKMKAIVKKMFEKGFEFNIRHFQHLRFRAKTEKAKEMANYILKVAFDYVKDEDLKKLIIGDLEFCGEDVTELKRKSGIDIANINKAKKHKTSGENDYHLIL
ncbi:ankyrin repeat domain-containing protein [Hydrogenothermus marinus]|uniref:Ankyrin repeat protein n=1 Tax=Hydrogenothermus marinus TaxID=133270 RepID=A0A3M0BUA3_9AQUI|nr:ankyrin repeat domain-containing protein [Hydrogenothermus marinus]RMB00065.1 ankyrin repeat protein [Hydrogenothermus marinus]